MADWIILNRPGLVPIRKGPFTCQNDLAEMLRGLYKLYHDCTCTVISMPDTSYPESGVEWLSIYERQN